MCHFVRAVEVAADELHTLESEEQVFLRVCLLVGPTKSALADEFSSSYLRKRMHFDLQRLRRVRAALSFVSAEAYFVLLYILNVLYCTVFSSVRLL